MTERLDISPDRWPDVSRVFSAAVGVDKGARQAYLDEACRDDAVLRVRWTRCSGHTTKRDRSAIRQHSSRQER